MDEIEVIPCSTTDDCITAIEKNKLSIGIVPILVTLNTQSNLDQRMIDYFERHSSIKKILKVNVNSTYCDVLDDYIQKKYKYYPAVYVMIDGILVDTMSNSADPDKLKQVYLSASGNPVKLKYVSPLTEGVSLMSKPQSFSHQERQEWDKMYGAVSPSTSSAPQKPPLAPSKKQKVGIPKPASSIVKNRRIKTTSTSTKKNS